jgi:hypothetical protein
MALKGNVNMLRWLGQNILNQTDKVEQKTQIEVKQLGPKEIEEVLASDPFALPKRDDTGDPS